MHFAEEEFVTLFTRAISKTRNSGTPEHRNTEHQNNGIVKFGNTGTAKILNLVQILKSFAGGRNLSFE